MLPEGREVDIDAFVAYVESGMAWMEWMEKLAVGQAAMRQVLASLEAHLPVDVPETPEPLPYIELDERPEPETTWKARWAGMASRMRALEYYQEAWIRPHSVGGEEGT